ncbi:MAG TPA: aldehyde-activating protein [Alphaproteobacteria bacterium]|nr:aldehyde-activating protein [Alphaproteobacteria bacterium]
MTHVLNGGCHCGALHLTFETPHAPAELPLRICTCSFCVKQGARYTADKDGRATFTAASSDLLHRYQFGTKTADILSCARCGTYVAAVTTVEGKLYAAINVNALDDQAAFARAPDVTNFSDQTPEQRGERRQSNWTPATLDFAAAAR